MRIITMFCLVAACVATTGRPIAAQQTGVISGAILDSASGRPLVGARLFAAPSRDITDSTGHFLVSRLVPGVVELGIFCPSRTMRGKLLLARRMRVGAGVTRLELRVDSTLCDEAPYREIRGEFRGSFSSGFEESDFSVCADSANGIPRQLPDNYGWSEVNAWVDDFTATASRTWDRALRVARVSNSKSGWPPRLYVHWVGTLRGPGMFGHMGVSPYGFAVDSVIYVGTANGDNCTRPPKANRP